MCERIEAVLRPARYVIRRWWGDSVRRSRWKAIAGIVVFLIVVLSFVARATFTAEQLMAHWRPPDLGSIVSSAILVLVCFVWAALFWCVAVHLLGGRLKLGRALRVYFLSALPRYVPGMIWGYVGRTYLCEKEGVARAVAILSMFAEVCLFVGTGLSVASFHWLSPVTAFSMTVVAVVVTVALLTLVALISRKGRYRLKQIGLTVLAWSLMALVYLAFWVLYGFSIVLLVQPIVSVNGLVQHLHILSGFALAWLAGFAAVFVPGGLGVREAGMALALEPIVGSLAAIYVAVLSRFLNLAADALLFFVALPKRRVAQRATSEVNSLDMIGRRRR